MRRLSSSFSRLLTALFLAGLGLCCPGSAQPLAPAPAPSALAYIGKPVDWVFMFKLNAGIFPSTETPGNRPCPFGGTATSYPQFSQQYAVATSEDPVLRPGSGLLGTAQTDPLGATFAQIYDGGLHYVVWNDQLYQHPKIAGCGDSCAAPWGHSKGIIAWNEAGEGVIIQVTTPSWPAAGNVAHPRAGDGNTLGCVNDNDVKVSQDFFSLRLTEADLEKVLDALANASVVTDVANPALVNNGGPAPVSAKVAMLGAKSPSVAIIDTMLSTGVRLISKPSALHVPPWQMVSSLLGGIDLRAATWWASPTIPSTGRDTPIACWDEKLAAPGAVEVATSGMWDGKAIGLRGGLPANGNHAKVGVSLSGKANYTIFGDMNQQGTLSGNCASSQNGRGGLFFVIDNSMLNTSVASLIAGDTAPSAVAH